MSGDGERADLSPPEEAQPTATVPHVSTPFDRSDAVVRGDARHSARSIVDRRGDGPYDTGRSATGTEQPVRTD
ncbi:MAG: hypothetical protein NVS3B21_01150 [Acidimicrobiales bacterium]